MGTPGSEGALSRCERGRQVPPPKHGPPSPSRRRAAPAEPAAHVDRAGPRKTSSRESERVGEQQNHLFQLKMIVLPPRGRSLGVDNLPSVTGLEHDGGEILNPNLGTPEPPSLSTTFRGQQEAAARARASACPARTPRSGPPPGHT